MGSMNSKFSLNYSEPLMDAGKEQFIGGLLFVEAVEFASDDLGVFLVKGDSVLEFGGDLAQLCMAFGVHELYFILKQSLLLPSVLEQLLHNYTNTQAQFLMQIMSCWTRARQNQIFDTFFPIRESSFLFLNNLLQSYISLYYHSYSHQYQSIIFYFYFQISMKPVEVRLVGRFRLQAKIPGEHEHVLYQAMHTQTDAPLFLKGQQIKNKPAPNFLSILQQGKILQTMQGGIGIPHMHWCGQEQDYNFIVLEELGSDLGTLFRKCNSKLTLKSVLMFGCEAISMLQYYHFKNFVHNNVNPRHFMIGAGEKYGKLFLVDYSNSIRYRDAQTLEHIAENVDKKIQMRAINMQFSSIRYQKGQTPSRKDDIISLLYVMLYFLKGQLPWSSIMNAKKSQNQKCKAILEIKQKITPQKLFQAYPQLALLYDYSDKLAFDEKPRYTYYKNVFGEKLEKEGQIDDKIYDWYLLEDEEDDELDLDLNFDVIPNQDEFIKQLSEQIKTREKIESQNGKQLGSDGQIAPGKTNKKKNDKECTIY